MHNQVRFLHHKGIENKIVEEIQSLEGKGYRINSCEYIIRSDDKYSSKCYLNTSLQSLLSVLSLGIFRGYLMDDHPGGAPSGFMHHVPASARISLENKTKDTLDILIRSPKGIKERIESLKATLGLPNLAKSEIYPVGNIHY